MDGGAGTAVDAERDSVLLPGHDVPLGRYTTVRRLLPHRERRMVGAWCFVDHFGPDDVAGTPGMRIPPHPHTGLQTVTWLLEGEILHRDSLGNVATARPGQLNVMTAGFGISHSEESPPDHPPVMHGLQLWAALPDATRNGPPAFSHHPELPVRREGDAVITVVTGEVAGVRSPAQVHTPLVAAEIRLDGATRLPLEPDFEYGMLTLTGTAEVAGTPLAPGHLLYLGTGRSDLICVGEGRLFLLGGEPFDEPLVMWWNFVARTHEEIEQARLDWMGGVRFGHVVGFDGGALPAPPMPTTRLKARDRHGRTLG
ncbi:MAG: pirin family protein [Micromonosporaceae bacterium]|jgi:redox-sensitive bicupin YhaK (pirin superfamily)